MMTYSKLLTQWLDSSASLQSRLILVLDTSKSNYWVKHVRSTTVAFVGRYQIPLQVTTGWITNALFFLVYCQTFSDMPILLLFILCIINPGVGS